jgi:hypothetical protein
MRSCVMRDFSAARVLSRRRLADDRLGAGLTGLGLVVLVVLLTGAHVRNLDMPAVPLPQGETLAVIGVAPNSEARAEQATAPAARPAPAPAAPASPSASDAR